MDIENANKSREAGTKVWESFLSQLAEAGGFFGGMFNSLKRFIKRYFWSLIVLGLIVSIAGAGLWWMQPTYYKAEMTVSYVHYEKKIYADMLAKLDHLLQAQETELLADLLGLSPDQIDNINYIRSFNIRKEPLIDDLGTEKVPFYIEIGIRQADHLLAYQEALVNYLNNTDFIQSRLDFMEKKSAEELIFLERRLAVADSLSQLYIIRDEGMNDEKTISRMELLEESLAIYSKMQEVRGLQAFNLNIEVLDGFIALENKSRSSLLTYLFYGFLLGLALRVLLLIFK